MFKANTSNKGKAALCVSSGNISCRCASGSVSSGSRICTVHLVGLRTKGGCGFNFR